MRAPRVTCETAGCRGRACVLCDYPVTRRRRPARCGRFLCRACAKPHEPRGWHCPPHARMLGAPEPAPAALVPVVVCAACFTASCHHGEMPCERRGERPPRVVSASHFRAVLGFEAAP